MSLKTAVLSPLLRIVNWAGGQPTNEPVVDDKLINGEKFVRFGKHNLFPELCQGLTYNVAPLATCVNTMAMYVAGTGVNFTLDGKKEDTATKELWQRITAGSPDIIEDVAYHSMLTNNRAWEVIYDAKGNVVEVAPMDAVRIRTSRADENGDIPGFYWCDDWAKYGKAPTQYKPTFIPSFDTKDRKEKAVLFRRGRGNDYYGFPKWLSAMTDAEVWERIPRFNRTQIDTGFRPAAHIHLFTNKDAKELTDVKAEVEMLLTGADAQTYAVTHGPLSEGAPQINKLERGDHAGELDTIGNRCELVLYKTFGLPPLLAGVDINTGMSGKSLALEQTVAIFQRTRILPEQKLLTRDIREILLAAGGKPNVIEIQQLRPFDAATDAVLNRQTYLTRTTVNQDLIANGLEPMDAKDPRGNLLLIEVMRGAVDVTSVEPPPVA